MNHRSLDWALCRSFLAILREGSLAAAGRALGVTHPTIRRHLDEFEASLGMPLFVRSPAGLLPTELALELRRPAEAMEAAAESLVRKASADGGSVAGTVRITASEVIGAEVVPPILASLRTVHQGLQFELRLSDAIDNLMQLEADVAIRMARPDQGDLVASLIGSVPAGFFAHEDWLARHGAPANLDELVSGGHLIGQDRRTSMLRVLVASGVHANRTDFSFRSDSDLAQVAAVRTAVGIGVMQLPLARKDVRLVRILPAFEHELEMWLVMHPSLRSTARINVTATALRAALQAYTCS